VFARIPGRRPSRTRGTVMTPDDTPDAPPTFPRIVRDPAILGGKPTVKGTRLSVEFLLELLATGGSRSEIVRVYPFLTEEDVEEAVFYAVSQLPRLLPKTVAMATT
ncbi:MAG: DUF433 domain-containing protein, partial [Gemmataceae bacterium]